jgi:hypothetical protein
MFSSYLRASLVALVASAIAVSAAPGLIVKMSSPEVEVDGNLDKRALGSIVKKSSPMPPNILSTNLPGGSSMVVPPTTSTLPRTSLLSKGTRL